MSIVSPHNHMATNVGSCNLILSFTVSVNSLSSSSETLHFQRDLFTFAAVCIYLFRSVLTVSASY